MWPWLIMVPFLLEAYSAPHPFRACIQNELAMLELIHCFVEVLDKHFGQVCELDIMNEPDMVRTDINLCLQCHYQAGM